MGKIYVEMTKEEYIKYEESKNKPSIWDLAQKLFAAIESDPKGKVESQIDSHVWSQKNTIAKISEVNGKSITLLIQTQD